MNIRHLQFFAAVVECKGVTRAAERLHVSQPAVSAGIRALEDEIGHRLFERSAGGKSVRPTDKGLAFYEHVVEILRRCDEARRTLAADQAAPLRLRVGVLRTISARSVAVFADDLARQAPGWRWRFREGSVNQLLDWLRRGRIDVAWTLVEGDGRRARMLWREAYVALLSPAHALARHRPPLVTAADLSQERLILRASCEMRPGVLQAAGLNLRPAAQVHRDELALELVSRGVGIAIGPSSYASKDVVGIEVAELTEVRSIGLRWGPAVPIEAVEALLRSRASMKNR